MKHAFKLLALVLAVLMMVGVLAACSGKVNPEPAPAENEEAPADEVAEVPVEEEPAGPVALTLGTTQAQGSFDNTSMAMNMGYMLVYDTVLTRDTEGNIVGAIAEEFEYVDDTTLQLTIRENVYFSNGALLTPEDVLFSLERFITTNSPYTTSTFYDNVIWDECTIEGNVLTIKFNNPCPAFTATLANPKWSCVLCKEYIESTGEDEFWDAPVGTGPYVLSKYEADSYMIFDLRDDYWGAQLAENAIVPQVEQFTIKCYAEETTMFIDYENGVLDACLGISDANLQRVVSGEVAGTYDIGSQYDYVMLCLPEYVEAFEDIAVREAIAHAIDYEALTANAFGDLGKTSTSTVLSGTEFYVDKGVYSYDPELSRQILADAGYEEGELVFRMVIVNFPANEKIANAMQDQLKDVGIELKVESYDLGTAMSYFMNSDLDISIGELNVPCVDPAQAYVVAEPTHTNAAMIQTGDEIVDLLYGAKYEMDAEARMEAYAQVQDWFYNNYRWLPIAEKLWANCYNERITGWDSFWITTYPDLKYIEVN